MYLNSWVAHNFVPRASFLCLPYHCPIDKGGRGERSWEQGWKDPGCGVTVIWVGANRPELIVGASHPNIEVTSFKTALPSHLLRFLRLLVLSLSFVDSLPLLDLRLPVLW